MLIPALKTIIDKSSENSVDQVIMGMPHRYRRHRLSPLATRPAVPHARGHRWLRQACWPGAASYKN